MRYVWTDGTCSRCGEGYRGFVADEEARNLCDACRPAPDIDHIKTLSILTFDPHFDRSLGVHFTSRREKQKYVKQNDLVDITDIKHIDDFPKPDTRTKMPKEFEQVYEEVIQSG